MNAFCEAEIKTTPKTSTGLPEFTEALESISPFGGLK
jgi:hypothetical protein